MRLHALNHWSLRYQHHIRKAVKWTIIFCVACLVFVGAYYAMSGYVWATTKADAEVKQANLERDEAYSVLNGEKAMVEYAGKYAVVERVVYQVKEN